MRFLRIVLILIAAVAGGVLAWDLFDGEERRARHMRGSSLFTGDGDPAALARRAVEDRLRISPEHRAFFASYRQAFAAEYERMAAGFAQRAAETGRLDPAERYLAEGMRTLRKSHGLLAAKAESGRLAALFDAQHALIDALGRADPQLCVDFLFGHATQRFYDFAARNRVLVARLAQTNIDAIIDGRDRQIERTAPTPEDFTTLERALRANGLGQPEIETLLDGKAAEPPLPDAGLCRAGRVYLETLRELPEDMRMRIYGLAVEVLARS
jgi:hypothetical protein